MYDVQCRAGDQWVVVDVHGQTLCSGTMLQCEDWLDGQDNLPATEPASRGQEAVAFTAALAPAVSSR